MPLLWSGVAGSWPNTGGNSNIVPTVANGRVYVAGRQLFQLHDDGSIWRYTGTPCSGTSCPGWQMLDTNPLAAAIAGADQLYQFTRTQVLPE